MATFQQERKPLSLLDLPNEVIYRVADYVVRKILGSISYVFGSLWAI